MGLIRKAKTFAEYTGSIPDTFVPVPNWDRYWVSPSGQVASTRRGQWVLMKQRPNAMGYVVTNLMHNDGRGRSKSWLVHRLIAETFLGHQRDKFVNHIDGNKSNNALINLEWVTAAENNQHAVDTGLRVYIKGPYHPSCKLTQTEVDAVRAEFLTGQPAEAVADRLGLPRSTVQRIVSNKVYPDAAYVEAVKLRKPLKRGPKNVEKT